MFKIKTGKLKAKWILPLFLGSAFLALADEPTITVVVTPNPIGMGDYGQLSIEVATDLGTHVGTPEFSAPDFDARHTGQSQSSVSYGENGKIVSHTKTTYIFELRPKHTGNFKITDIHVVAGNKDIKSPNLNIIVTAQGTPSQNQNPNGNQGNSEEEEESNPAFPQRFFNPRGFGNPNQPPPSARSGGSHPDTLNSDFTVHLDLSKKSAYVGEPIIASFYIYDFGGVNEIKFDKMPSFNSFWKEDLEQTGRVEWENFYINQRRVRRAFLGRYAIYGLKPGKVLLDRMVIEAAVLDRRQMQEDGDPFALFFGSVGNLRKAKHASEEVTVEILPLPDSGRPANFGGAVGQFTMKVEADKATVPANNPITVTASIAGRGNFQAIDGIKIPFPADFELYESTSKMVGAGRGTDGMKNFQSIVIPRKQGSFQIPPVEWSFFDPAKKSYVTIKSDPLNITVTEGAATASNQNSYLSGGSTSGTAGDSPGVEAKEDLRYLKSSASSALQWRTILGIFSIVLAVLNLFLLGRLLWPHREKFRKAVNAARPFYEAQSQLEVVRSAPAASWIDSVDLFLEKLNEGLLGISGKSMTMRELEEHWTQAGLSLSFAHQKKARELLDTVRFAGNRSSGSPDLKNKVILELAESLKKAQSK